MISEHDVIDFFHSKDRTYIENFMNSLLHPVSVTPDDTHSHCPYCGSSHIKKNGKDHLGNQRFYCHECHHSFSERTGTFLFHTHLSLDTWRRFIDYEVTGMSLKEEAYYLSLSITTCFYMRHKLYHAVMELRDGEILSESAQLDSMYLKINLKGTKPKNMPRISKKRGGSSAYRGISHHKICVICSLDSNDHMIMKVTGLGEESFEKYQVNERYFKDIKEIISDSKTSIQQFANHIKAANHKIPTVPNQKRYQTENGESLADINELMNEIATLITITKGFSTRYMQGYLEFQQMKKQMKYQYKRKEVADEILKRIIHTHEFRQVEVRDTPMPISLKEAYYEYHYGIFAN